LTASDLAAFGITPGPGGNGRVIFDLAPNYKNTYTIQASLSIARQLNSSLSLEVGYQMYRGVHIPLDQETNFKETGVIDPEWGPQYTAINPAITQNNTYSSIGNSIYNGLTTSLTKRYSNHLQAQINYTFSKAIDDVTDFNSQFASFFPTRLYMERGISDYNIAHNFSANAVYSTPSRVDRVKTSCRARLRTSHSRQSFICAAEFRFRFEFPALKTGRWDTPCTPGRGMSAATPELVRISMTSICDSRRRFISIVSEESVSTGWSRERTC